MIFAIISHIRYHWLRYSLLLAVALLIASTYFLDFSHDINNPGHQPLWGVTFSSKYATEELGLDWKETYLAILDDLKVNRIRISAYWDEIEKRPGEYDFKDLDWMIAEAGKRKALVVLAVGRRLPRWPECHDPSWLSGMNSLKADENQLNFTKAVANRYGSNNNIIYWQVENEPFLSSFGICPLPNENLLKEEIAAVKTITNKPIMVTDSGELSTWWPITNAGGDILGTTLYRVVYNERIGYFHWFTPPFFYWARVQLAKQFTPTKKFIVAELQGESWHAAGKNLTQMTQAEHDQSMSVQQLKDNINFTRQAGFNEAYLWGVEWWYYMKIKGNNQDYWNVARVLWQ